MVAEKNNFRVHKQVSDVCLTIIFLVLKIIHLLLTIPYKLILLIPIRMPLPQSQLHL